ncbi:hypothetical protein [Humibacter albus]|uniref:hypothetical protein n=1 Tax=Humibacter albus TaxID=427754 RepID=UPI0003B312E2|nr:hypothetical protein [Humibacter albus]
MSTVTALPARGFAFERWLVRVGRLLIAWGEHRERIDESWQDVYRHRASVREDANVRAATVRSGLLP